LRIPAGDGRIIAGNVRQRVHAGRAWWVLLQPVFEEFLAGDFVPEPVVTSRADGVFLEEGIGGVFRGPLELHHLG
jgi:hypothetical protein